MLSFWIDVEGADGTRYGPGPITTAMGWQMTPRLDGAGTFSFTMAVSDPLTPYVINKRIVRCRGILDGVVTELGAGIIDNISLVPGNPTMQTVSGNDIMTELAGPSVHRLIVREQAWTNLAVSTHGLVALVKQTRDAKRSADATPLAHDGNNATSNAFDMRRDVNPAGFPEANNWTYVGYDARWDAVRWTLKAGGRVNERNSFSRVQYYNGSGWVDEAIVSDGTNGGAGRSFAQSGIMTFARPANWERYNEAVVTGGDWFWRRFGVTVGSGNEAIGPILGGAYVDIAEVDVYADFPTTNGVNLIMALAPSTWTRSGYPATVSPKYLEFKGQSVLEALVILAEQGGKAGGAAVREHFRLGTGRAISWMGTTVNASGVRAVSPTDPIAAEGAPELALIERLQRQVDSAEVVTRIYPESADGMGIGPATDAAPTGYTRGYITQGVNTYWYLQHTAGYAAYGLLERHVEFSELSLEQADSYTTHPIALGNQLQERGAEFLRTHAMANQFYRLSVVQFPALILPGDTIECVYHEWIIDPVTGAVHTVNIDTIRDASPLRVLAPTLTIDTSGVSVQALEVATIDREPKTDARVVVDLVRQQKQGAIAASNLITISGTIPPPPPVDLGGWLIGDLAIEKNDAVLHSDGWIQLGAGDNIVRLDAQDATYRLWAGAVAGADAPFSVDTLGVLRATGAVISGTITAELGAIGGWTIKADALVGGAAELNSAGYLFLGTGSDIVVLDAAHATHRIWVGDAVAADAPFSVTKAGVLTAQGATIEGALTATTGELVDLDVSGLLNLVAGGIIQSDNYAAAVSGWQIRDDGSAEFQDVLVRGTLNTVVFQENTVSTVAGTIRVEPSPTTTELTAELTIPAVSGTTAMDVKLVYPLYEVNDEVTIVDPSSEQQGTLVIAAVLSSGGGDISYLVRNDGDATPSEVFPIGSMVYKVTTDPGYLLMTANPVLGGPRYAVVDSSGGVDTLVGVFGNLDGSFGVATKEYGIGVGDFLGGNYMLYEPTNGFVMKAGGGAVTLDEDGISIDATEGIPNRIKFVGDQGNPLMWLYAKEELSYADTWLATIGQDATHHTAQMYLQVQEYASATELARLSLVSRIGSVSQIRLEAESVVIQGSESPDYDVSFVVHGDLSVGGSISDTVPISLRASREANAQSVANSTVTVVTYDTTDWSQGSPAAEKIVLSSNKFYAKVAGLYLCEAQIQYDAPGGAYLGIRWVGIRVNGTNMEGWHGVTAVSSVGATPLSTSQVVKLAVDDYVEVMTRQTSTISLALSLAPANDKQANSFTMTRIA